MITQQLTRGSEISPVPISTGKLRYLLNLPLPPVKTPLHPRRKKPPGLHLKLFFPPQNRVTRKLLLGLRLLVKRRPRLPRLRNLPRSQSGIGATIAIAIAIAANNDALRVTNDRVVFWATSNYLYRNIPIAVIPPFVGRSTDPTPSLYTARPQCSA